MAKIDISTKSQTIEFDREKETPGTVRFKEKVVGDAAPLIDTLYIKKAFKGIDGAKSIKVTVEITS